MTVVHVGPGDRGSSTPSQPVAFEYDAVPGDGETLLIPQTDALLINVLLWPEGPISDVQLILPAGLVAGRRVFIYADQAITQLTVTAEDNAFVANNVVSLNMNDLVVFNTVSTVNKIWARVATS